MCLPLCLKTLHKISRRKFLGTAITATAGVGAFVEVANGETPGNGQPIESFLFSRVLDLTHTLTPDFPTGSGQQQLVIETMSTWPKDQWTMRRWHIDEHTGTHLDAPLHRSDKDSADLIPASHLVGPLAVVDIRRKAADNADAELTLDDLKTWEAQHGPLPAGAIVAMCAGRDAHVRSAKFRNSGGDGVVHTPGFHIEVVEFLLTERDVKGIVVDTLSHDPGRSKEFPVHVRWLGSNRWGLECAAHLGDLPAKGATLVVAGPKIAGATGGPSRVFALI
jgi:kynurenine formamidase